MKAEYSKHLLHRLILRKIDHDLPRTIFEQSVEHYDDMETGHGIATMAADLYGKPREVMVALRYRGWLFEVVDNSSVERRSERESYRFRQVEENNMNEFKVHYDEAEDILHLGREGQENEVVELSPGVNIELDDKGKLIGIELFKASLLFRNVLGLMGKKINQAAWFPVPVKR
jgi:uncharacterized protein YuzE